MSSSAPEWENISLPSPDILRHRKQAASSSVLTPVTDAHCHPTDSTHGVEDIRLGGLAAMATQDDQDAVATLAENRPWPSSSGVGVIPAFGYHPWFAHRFTLSETTKEEHYRSILSPRPEQEDKFAHFLPLLPDPEPFAPRLERIRENIAAVRKRGRKAIVGEIGVDSGAKVPWSRGDSGGLTPFKTCMAHQSAIARAQIDLAVELGVSVSMHAHGAVLPLLSEAMKAHGKRFSRTHVCIHSCTLAPNEVAFLAKKGNFFFSPSVAITAGRKRGDDAVRSIPDDRVLVESDAGDVEQMERRVWAAVLWVARVKGWEVEDVWGDQEGTVHILERNWDKFLL